MSVARNTSEGKGGGRNGFVEIGNGDIKPWKALMSNKGKADGCEND